MLLARHQKRLNAALPLVLFTDDSGRDWLSAARRLPRGSVVILRGKERAELLDALRPLPLRLLAADDPDLAKEADGLHLPERRAREAAHWRARHPDWIITASAHSLRALLTLNHVDAAFLSPVFPTTSHPGAATLTLLRAGMIARQAMVPVYALGGVDARNAARLPPGFCGIAAITALSC
jgi:thiamine-phosphate pyrophosphorylase